jgi:hypothetical protein
MAAVRRAGVRHADGGALPRTAGCLCDRPWRRGAGQQRRRPELDAAAGRPPRGAAGARRSAGRRRRQGDPGGAAPRRRRARQALAGPALLRRPPRAGGRRLRLAFYTEDGGQNWQAWTQRLPNPKGAHLYALAGVGRHAAGRGRAGPGAALRPTAGATFRRLELPYQGSFFTAELPSPREIVVAGLRGNVWRSGDGGQNWAQVASPICRCRDGFGTQARRPAAAGQPGRRQVLQLTAPAWWPEDAAAAARLTLNASFDKMIPRGHPYIQNYLDNRVELRGLGNSLRIVVENPQRRPSTTRPTWTRCARSTTSCSSRPASTAPGRSRCGRPACAGPR